VLVDLHPLAVQAHFLLSMVLVANATVLVRRAGEPDGVPRRRAFDDVTTRLVWILALATTAAIVTGTIVTGAGPHAGDEEARRFGFDIAHVARVHGITVMATIALALVLVRRLGQRMGTWLFVAALQAVVGYVQYFNDVPAVLVGAHVAGATALYVVTVQLVLDTRTADTQSSRSVFDEVAHVGL
jgi:cytochrome c oxidase assembly protein subunit 15